MSRARTLPVVLSLLILFGCSRSTPTGPRSAPRDTEFGLRGHDTDSEAGFQTPEARGMTVAFNDGFLSREDVEAQDFLQRMGVFEAHAVTRGAGVTVAVLDTGVDPAHPDLAGRLRAGFDFVDGDADPWETRDLADNDGDGLVDEGYGHGTHLAGLVALLAPEAEILVYRVLDDEGRGQVAWIEAALDHALENGADVINLSLGMTEEVDGVADGLQAANQQGVPVLASVGNEGTYVAQFPASEKDVLGIGSVDGNDHTSDFCNYGKSLFVTAPGENIVSTAPGGGYATLTGTSASTVMATCLVTLYRAQDSSLSCKNIEKRLGKSTEDFGQSDRGRISFLSVLD